MIWIILEKRSPLVVYDLYKQFHIGLLKLFISSFNNFEYNS